MKCRITLPLAHSLLTFSFNIIKVTLATEDIHFIGETPVRDQETPKNPFTLYGLQPKDKRHRPNYTLVDISGEGMYCKAIQNKITIIIGKKTLSRVEEEPKERGIRTNMRSIFNKKLGKRETQDFLYICCEGYLHSAHGKVYSLSD